MEYLRAFRSDLDWELWPAAENRGNFWRFHLAWGLKTGLLEAPSGKQLSLDHIDRYISFTNYQLATACRARKVSTLISIDIDRWVLIGIVWESTRRRRRRWRIRSIIIISKRNERLVPDFIYKLDSRTRSALRLRVTSYDSVSVSDSAAASASDYSGCFEFWISSLGGSCANSVTEQSHRKKNKS